jgi:hypothetical protein
VNPGEVIAVTFWGLVVTGCGYGLSCDLRRWLGRRVTRRQLLALNAELDRALEYQNAVNAMLAAQIPFPDGETLDRLRVELAEIQNLPTVEPVRRLR